MKVRFNFEWRTKLTPEEIEKLNAIIEPEIIFDEEYPKSWVEHTGDLTEIYAVKPDLKLTVLGLAFPEATFNNFAIMMHRLETRMNEMLNATHMFNAKCDVHVPGLGLLAIDEVTYREDYCTDSLRSMLEDGWRIIAACPQPDQRRPDYVFGRSRK